GGGGGAPATRGARPAAGARRAARGNEPRRGERAHRLRAHVVAGHLEAPGEKARGHRAAEQPHAHDADPPQRRDLLARGSGTDDRWDAQHPAWRSRNASIARLKDSGASTHEQWAAFGVTTSARPAV